MFIKIYFRLWLRLQVPKKFRLHRLLNTVSLLTTWVVFHLSFWKYRNVFNQAKYHTFRINGIFTTTGAFLSSVNQTSGHWRDIHTDAHVELSESWCYIDILDAKACYQKLALMRQNKTSKNRVKRFRYRYWLLIARDGAFYLLSMREKNDLNAVAKNVVNKDKSWAMETIFNRRQCASTTLEN